MIGWNTQGQIVEQNNLILIVYREHWQLEVL